MRLVLLSKQTGPKELPNPLSPLKVTVKGWQSAIWKRAFTRALHAGTLSLDFQLSKLRRTKKIDYFLKQYIYFKNLISNMENTDINKVLWGHQ